jgi:hypothetical protein
MTEISDLESRKAALTRAVEEATAERDEVRRQLAEARGLPLPPRPPRPAPRWLPAVILAGSAVVLAGLVALTDRATNRTYACHELPSYQADNERAFQDALAAHGLEKMTHGMAGYYERSNPRTLIVPQGDELARDHKGGVWRIQRQPDTHYHGAYKVHGCDGACGDRGGGAAMMWSYAIEPGETLRDAAITIPYDEDLPRVIYDGPMCLPPV